MRVARAVRNSATCVWNKQTWREKKCIVFVKQQESGIATILNTLQPHGPISKWLRCSEKQRKAPICVIFAPGCWFIALVLCNSAARFTAPAQTQTLALVYTHNRPHAPTHTCANDITWLSIPSLIFPWCFEQRRSPYILNCGLKRRIKDTEASKRRDLVRGSGNNNQNIPVWTANLENTPTHDTWRTSGKKVYVGLFYFCK